MQQRRACLGGRVALGLADAAAAVVADQGQVDLHGEVLIEFQGLAAQGGEEEGAQGEGREALHGMFPML
ncbi:hypothetical protein FQZ97_592090 [compost metagenome]